MTVSEDQAQRMRLAADRLATAERGLIAARKQYAQALRAWDSCAQVKLETEEKK